MVENCDIVGINADILSWKGLLGFPGFMNEIFDSCVGRNKEKLLE